MGTTLEYREGYAAYADGDTYCPYPAESVEYYDWYQGWDDAEQDDQD